MPITVTCKCKKTFQAPDLLAGKTVKCPNCTNPLSIPSQALQDDLFDDLADLAAATEFASAADHHGGGSSGRSPGGSLGHTSSPLHLHRPSKGVPLGLIIGGGAVAAALIIGLVVLLIASGPGDSRRGVSANNGPPADSPNTNDRTAPSYAGTARANPTNPSGNQTASVPEQGAADSANAILSGIGSLARAFSGSNTAGPDTGPNLGQSGPGTSEFLSPNLRPGLIQWHSGGRLVSTQRAGDSDVHELHYGWMVGLLPHLGYQDHYDEFDFEKPWHDEANLPHAAREIPEFLNPADERKEYEGYRYNGMALTHFVGVSGVEDRRNVVAATLPRSDPRAGIFGYEDIAKPREIRDGTSRTIMMIGAGELACPWVQSGGSTIRGAREPYFGELTGFGTNGGTGKGAVAVMADGSVRWIKADVDPKVFGAMCTIGAGD